MSTKENLQWAKSEAEPAMRALLGQGVGKDVDPNKEVISGGVEQAISFTRLEREKYVGEVGKREGNYIYHFWPRTEDLLATFGDKLGDAFLRVFKFPERVSAKHDEVYRCMDGVNEDVPTSPVCGFWGTKVDFEKGCMNCGSSNFRLAMSSWSVRVVGYAGNPMADDLASSVFEILDSLV